MWGCEPDPSDENSDYKGLLSVSVVGYGVYLEVEVREADMSPVFCSASSLTAAQARKGGERKGSGWCHHDHPGQVWRLGEQGTIKYQSLHWFNHQFQVSKNLQRL